MPQENVEILMKALRLADEEEIERISELLDSDAVLTGMSDWPEPGPHVGAEAVVAQFARLRTDWAEQRFENVRIVAERGDWVVAEYRWRARGAASGLEADFDLVVAARMNRGAMAEIHYRWTRDEALEAAGLTR